jgi:hypothetical protein
MPLKSAHVDVQSRSALSVAAFVPDTVICIMALHLQHNGSACSFRAVPFKQPL